VRVKGRTAEEALAVSTDRIRFAPAAAAAAAS
jgi:hypothetical protein